MVHSPAALFVVPVGGYPILGKRMHLPCPYLHFQRLTGRTDHSRMKGLVKVALWVGYIIIKLARNRFPYGMYYPKDLVAVSYVFYYDP